VNVSTVGRILAALFRPSRHCAEGPPQDASASTLKNATLARLPKRRNAKRAGELVQIDTPFVNVRPGVASKHFTACDPASK
jgi:putative transposase